MLNQCRVLPRPSLDAPPGAPGILGIAEGHQTIMDNHAEYTALLVAMGILLLEEMKKPRRCTTRVSTRRENQNSADRRSTM